MTTSGCPTPSACEVQVNFVGRLHEGAGPFGPLLGLGPLDGVGSSFGVGSLFGFGPLDGVDP